MHFLLPLESLAQPHNFSSKGFFTVIERLSSTCSKAYSMHAERVTRWMRYSSRLEGGNVGRKKRTYRRDMHQKNKCVFYARCLEQWHWLKQHNLTFKMLFELNLTFGIELISSSFSLTLSLARSLSLSYSISLLLSLLLHFSPAISFRYPFSFLRRAAAFFKMNVCHAWRPNLQKRDLHGIWSAWHSHKTDIWVYDI